MNFKSIKQEICDVCHMIWEQGYVAANDGNISIKVDENRFLATPTGISKRLIKPDMILELDGNGNVLSKNKNKYRPTSETPMHLRCYHERDDITAVVHAHPPYATAFAVANLPMDSYCMPECIITLGAIPLSKFGEPGTDQTENAVAELLPNNNALLLRNHGVVTVGENLTSAFYRLETVEHCAKVIVLARLLGGEKELTAHQIKTCIDAHDALKIPGRYPGYVKGEL